MSKPKKPLVKVVPASVPASFHIDKRADAILAASANTGNDDDLLTTPQVADLLGVSTQWIEKRRTHGGGPPFVRLSQKIVRYPRDGLRHWLDQRARARIAEYRPKRGAKRRVEVQPDAS
jgi:predicted DNA-binding transcriptional regulator AlpA